LNIRNGEVNQMLIIKIIIFLLRCNHSAINIDWGFDSRHPHVHHKSDPRKSAWPGSGPGQKIAVLTNCFNYRFLCLCRFDSGSRYHKYISACSNKSQSPCNSKLSYCTQSYKVLQSPKKYHKSVGIFLFDYLPT